jgi:hypothetical protein
MTYLVAALVVAAALAAVAWPLFRNEPNDVSRLDDERLEARITQYREALTAHTVCHRCLRDNPTDARYCAECGNRLQEIEEVKE